jgi:hypothetical protein
VGSSHEAGGGEARKGEGERGGVAGDGQELRGVRRRPRTWPLSEEPVVKRTSG